MHSLSKKQLEHLLRTPGLLAGALLLCFPAGIPIKVESSLLIPALLCGILSVGIAHTLLKLGRLPSFLRIGFLLPLATSSSISLLVLPSPLTVLWLVVPVALILLWQREFLKGWPPFLLYPTLALVLGAGSLPLLHRVSTQANEGLPSLPHHLFIWLGVFAVIPLGFATRQRLRALAKAIARYELLALAALLGLYPLLWTAATAGKIPGETPYTFHELRPHFRFFLLPKDEIPDLMPSELRNHPLQTNILFTLNEMTWRLNDVYLASLFNPEAQLSPSEMLRSLKLYGFLLEDRHGAFLPGDSFSREAPPEMDPRYVKDFRQAMNQIVISPAELAELMGTSPTEATDVLEAMKDLQWVNQVPGEKPRYRLTPQARKPFENGLTPRQLLLLNRAQTEIPVELEPGSYVPRRELSYRQIRQEFQQLATLGAAQTRQVWQLNQHASFFRNPDLWRHSLPYLFTLPLALMIGFRLPRDLPQPLFVVLTIGGLVLCIQWSLPSYMISGLRIAVGFWIVRTIFPLRSIHLKRLALFVSCAFLISVLLPSLPETTALVHQCLWALIWTLPSVLILILAIRPLPQTELASSDGPELPFSSQ